MRVRHHDQPDLHAPRRFALWSRHGGLFLSGLLSVLLLASGCALLPQPEIRSPTEPEPATPALPASISVSRYRVTDATLEIHTYRAGWLSGQAHNHIMETRQVGGTIHLAQPIESSTARLYFRPWDLILDDPSSRDRAGAGFESERSPEDIAATRTRMLGPRGFDSNEFPWVIVDVSWLDDDEVALLISFRDDRIDASAPISWSVHEGTLVTEVDFELSHRALGIRPYSAFAGAIAVADPIRVQLKLSARPDPSL